MEDQNVTLTQSDITRLSQLIIEKIICWREIKDQINSDNRSNFVPYQEERIVSEINCLRKLYQHLHRQI
jgi:hypothetical protein